MLACGVMSWFHGDPGMYGFIGSRGTPAAPMAGGLGGSRGACVDNGGGAGWLVMDEGGESNRDALGVKGLWNFWRKFERMPPFVLLPSGFCAPIKACGGFASLMSCWSRAARSSCSAFC